MSTWPGRSSEEKRGFDEYRAVREKVRKDEDKALARAVANVLDGSCSIGAAAEGQGLPVSRVSKAVKAARESKP